ncbi:cytochrome P450 [Streptomyces sp. HNM0575]|uniref:cytochrome P450 n=1 Tax=Streptomyces sp. HNM0575 TaxID=2716338 RepID=UPI00145CA4AF|nr:cytochrome P450 [Streptomyces sp. HNM0575]NLU73952.1 cytochrome P450 [Streptomyces sp. HNM0575]
MVDREKKLPTKSTGTTEAPYVFDPFAPGFSDDPYPHYARLRGTDPVHEHPKGFWIVSRHADVVGLLRAKHSVEDDNVTKSRIHALSMMDQDPPDHTRLRRLLTKVFTERAVNGLAPLITDLVDKALDRVEQTVAEQGQADLVAELAYPLPLLVICEMLGMEADYEWLRERAAVLAHSLEPVADPGPELIKAIETAETELVERIAGVIEAKRKAPARENPDLLTQLIQAEDGGDVLSDEELIAQVVLLYLAGYATTMNLLANGVVALLRHPAQLELLRTREDLDANAADELLRYDTSVQYSRRITLSPHEAGGKVIPAGATVLAGLASANRDEAVFGPSADELRLDRPEARKHVSFGGGPHHCLGAALARLEIRIAVCRLVRRFDRLALADDIAWHPLMITRGPVSVPVTV